MVPARPSALSKGIEMGPRRLATVLGMSNAPAAGAVLLLKPLHWGEMQKPKGDALSVAGPLRPDWKIGPTAPTRHGGLLSAVGTSNELCSRGRTRTGILRMRYRAGEVQCAGESSWTVSIQGCWTGTTLSEHPVCPLKSRQDAGALVADRTRTVTAARPCWKVGVLKRA